MEKVISEGSPKTPRLVVDPEEGKILISGRSNPENSREFFAPFMEWLVGYLENPAEFTSVMVNLEHFNTSSSKFILDILKRIKKLEDSDKDFKITWLYEEDDLEMLDTAEAYEAMVGIGFEKVPYPEPKN